MDDWLKLMQSRFNTVTKDIDDLLVEASQQSGKAAEQLFDSSIEAMDEIERLVAPPLRELDRHLDQSLETSFFYLDRYVTPWLEEVTAPVTRTVNPWLQNHSACMGCRHYHGMAYGDQMMVCAMYPYGPESESCNDWESVWTENQSD